MRWAVYYGDAFSASDAQKLDLAVLEPDHITPARFPNSKTKFYGYLSVGEVNPSRKYWPKLKDQDFVAGQNPIWKSYLMDIRSLKWQKILLDEIIPDILAKGYQGLFLDTIDTASKLEEKDPLKYAGSGEAMIGFIRSIKQKFPHVLILANNGLEMLPKTGDVIAGVVYEELYLTYNFNTKKSEKTPPEDTAHNEAMLDRFKSQFHKPVFNIIYEASPETPLAKYAIERSKTKGYDWYLTTVDLMQMGTVSP